MPSINYISFITSLVPSCFESRSNCLEESSAGMSLPICFDGTNSRVYCFDKRLDSKNYPNGLFPFFNKIPSAHSMCDYIIFAQVSGKLFCLSVELKRGDNQTHPQLYSGECFLRFIIRTLNRINNLSITPVYRHIAVHNFNIIKKGPTKVKPIRYDKDGYAEFAGHIFNVLECLK